MAAILAFIPVVIDIAAPPLKISIGNVAAKNIRIVLLIFKDYIVLCNFLCKLAVSPALAALGAFPILDITLMFVGSVSAGRLDSVVVDNNIVAGVGVLAQLVGLVAGLNANAAVFAVNIAAVTFAVDGSFNCAAGFSVNMVVGVHIAIGKATGGADSRRLTVCRAAGVRADIGAFSTSRTLLSMIDSVTFGEFYP